MASGNFAIGVSKKRPGTYINFEDTKTYVLGGAEVVGGAGLNGDGWNLPDYKLGKILNGMAVEKASTTHIIFEYLPTSADNYCGVQPSEIRAVQDSKIAVEAAFVFYHNNYPRAAADLACGTI